MASIARPFSFACLVEVFGVAAEHRAVLGPALTVLFDRPEHGAPAVIEAAVTVEDTIRSELARRSAGGGHRGDDVLSMIARGAAPEAEGCRAEADLDHEDVVSLAGTLLMGAFDSTAQMIGLAAATLLSRPALWARAIADPAGLSDVVEELLRWDSPGPFSTPRRATEELCIGGVAIPRGSRVILALGAANRDPLRHADPEQLDPDRHSSDRGEPRCPVTGPGAGRAPRHLAFGSGMHACPGAALARLELAVALRELLTGYPQTRLTVPVAQLRRLGSLHRRLAELPVALAG
jgi:cytochrome P450